MPTKKVTRKIISKEKPQKVVAAPAQELLLPTKTKKVCTFCQTKTSPSYTDTAALRRFLTDRSRILPKLRSGLCSKHQRLVTRHIKYARHLALLPFTPKV